MHPLLRRQLDQLGLDAGAPPDAAGWKRLLEALARPYQQIEERREDANAEPDAPLGLALRSANACTWNLDLRTGEVVLSEGWAAMLGQAPRPTRTTFAQLLALVPPAQREHGQPALVEALKGLRPDYVLEHHVRTADGAEKWILSHGRVTERDPRGGRALRMSGINLDITERKRAESALSQRQARLAAQQETLVLLAKSDELRGSEPAQAIKAMVEAAANTLAVARVSYWRMDELQTALECADLFELKARRHSRGMRLARADYPRYFAALEKDEPLVAEDARADPRTSEFAAAYLEPEGIGAMLGVPVLLRGRLAGVLCYEHVGGVRRWEPDEELFASAIASLASLALERSERARAERALAESEARLRLLFDSVPGAIASVDREERFRAVNQPYAEMVGRSAGEIVGRSVREVLGEAQYAQIQPMLARVFAGEKVSYERRVPGSGGEERVFRVRYRPERGRDADGKAQIFVGLFTDVTALRRAEAGLVENERRLSALFANLPGYAYRCLNDPGWTILFASPGVEDLTGYTPEDFTSGRVSFESLIAPEDRGRTHEIAGRALAQQAPFQLEYRIRTRAGAERWLWERGRGVYDVDGRLLQLEGLIVDATERKRAELALAENEARFRALTALSSDWYWEQDEHFRFVEISREVEEKIGTSAASHIGKTRWELPFDGVTEAQWAAHRAQLEAQQPFRDFEYQRTNERGEVIWLSVSGDPVFDAAGRFAGYRGVGRNITERKRLEIALQQANEGLERRVAERTMELQAALGSLGESEQRLRAVIDAVPTFIYCKDRDGVYLICNRANAALFGKTPQELLGVVPRTPGSDSDAAARISTDETIVRETGRTRVTPEFRMLDRDGRERVFHCTRIPFRFSDEHPDAVLGVVVDITDLKAAQEEVTKLNAGLEKRIEERTAALEKARDAAQAASRAKGEFLATMSHEIRTPMNAVVGLAHLALQRGGDPQQRDYLAKIDTAAKSLLRIISDVLDLSKVEAGKLELENAQFDLYSLLDDTVAMAATQARDKGLEFLLDAAADLPGELVGDPVRLGQVLANLCGNAVKFTERGKITLEVRHRKVGSKDVRLEFWVRDTGIGISAADRAKLFEPFTQSDSSTTRKYGGTGLGLSISQRLVGLMGGRIAISSEPGKGSTFSFTVLCGQAARKTAFPEAHVAPLRGKRVLVIDDDEAFQRLAQEYLEGWQMQFSGAEDARQGIERLAAATQEGEPFDLVLLDWKLPDMDGLEANALIRGDARIAVQPKVLLFTAYRDARLEELARVAGLDGVVHKPFSPAVLAAALLQAVRPGAAARQARPDLDMRGQRILLVEDDAVNQEVALRMLELTGATVVVAGNGREALEAIKDGIYAAVLTDLQMPEMDGIEATRLMRRDPALADLPIIAMTASVMAGDRERLIEAGMNDYIAKPISTGILYSTLARWLNR